ncbi:MAG: response regulator [Desulfobacterales bacterium]|jgi:DNA-binding response OmpR family regulator|nr:MAG: response regulator [Desulfobacterales bacterium]
MTSDENVKSDRIRLLLVDDEEGFVNVLSKRISRRNIDVTRAFSGSEAIQALRLQAFDVAVLDLKMEDLDGLEVLKIFKIMDPQLAVIMLTGHGSTEAAKKGMDLGAFDYLTKPCELEELLEKITAAYTAHKRV